MFRGFRTLGGFVNDAAVCNDRWPAAESGV
jgi:hypothetical protein